MNLRVNQSGFTLIEMLIAVVVISVGILGVAAMQTLGVRYTQNSYLLSIATQQAQDMAERMRANPAEMFDTSANGYYNSSISGAFTGTIPNCETADCTSDQRAQKDHAEWTQANQNLFGQTGTVARTGTNDFLITVNWNDVEDTGAVNKEYRLRFLP